MTEYQIEEARDRAREERATEREVLRESLRADVMKHEGLTGDALEDRLDEIVEARR